MCTPSRIVGIVVAVGLASACTSEKNAGSSAATSATTPATSAWTVTPSGIGPIRVGMSAADLKRVGGDITLPDSGAECVYVRPPNAPSGVLVMLAHGQVARVDIDSAGVQSDAGVAVGDSVARVIQAYAGRVTVTPHKYVQGAQYLTVQSPSLQDSTRRIVFESDSGHVKRFRSGRVPEVEWVERCG